MNCRHFTIIKVCGTGKVNTNKHKFTTPKKNTVRIHLYWNCMKAATAALDKRFYSVCLCLLFGCTNEMKISEGHFLAYSYVIRSFLSLFILCVCAVNLEFFTHSVCTLYFQVGFIFHRKGDEDTVTYSWK